MITLDRARQVAVVVLAAATLAGTAWALVESYHALYDWALGHKIPPPFAGGFPATVDMFVVYGEIRLFLAAVDLETSRWVRGWYWTMTLAGLAASVAGNIGHIGATATISDRLTNAIPPLAAAAGLGAGLGLVKLTARSAAAPASLAVTEPSPAPPVPARTAITNGHRPRQVRSGVTPPEAIEAARELFAQEIRAGNDLSPRKAVTLARESGLETITRYRATQIIEQITTTTTGGREED